MNAFFPLLGVEAGLFDDFEVPAVLDLFELPYFALEGTPFAINRTVLITLAASLIGSAFMFLALNRARVVPGRLQAAGEMVVEFIREQIAIPVMGPDGRAWVPFLTLLFLFVWLNNIFGVLPFVNFPPTSRVALPLFLSLIIYLTFNVVGVIRQGPRYFVDVLFPPGVPKPLYVIIAPIEFISVFLVRPLTLTVRLFANMVAGHVVLTIVFLAVNALILDGIGLIALAIAPVLVGFEFVVGVLQAYIMTTLAAVYIGGALHPDH